MITPQSSDPRPIEDTIAWLRTPRAVRERCGEILAATEAGTTSHFSVNRAALEKTAAFVADVTRETFPTLEVPYHSRWRHFSVGGVDRAGLLDRAFAGRDKADLAKAEFDLAIVSVLLDAGAGEQWTYKDSTDQVYSRSEGLAVASFDMFAAGRFSSDRGDPYRVDANRLTALDQATLSEGFQVSESNPLVGLPGRTALLRRLGEALGNKPKIFGDEHARPGELFNYLANSATGNTISAADILITILHALAEIWPGGSTLAGVPLGDVWTHPAVMAEGDRRDLNGWIPFHKLSQWLTYSLIEPTLKVGFSVNDIGELTPLAEYRNGGLLVDCGVLVPNIDSSSDTRHGVGSELIVEWRALTVALIDELAPLVRDALEVDEAQFPLAKVLEGGTWRAGRRIANELRSGGRPPISVNADGTVF